MAPKVRISSTVIDKLTDVTSTCTGRLFGVMCDKSLTILSFVLNLKDEDDRGIQPSDLQLNMPAEIDLVGILSVGDCMENITDAFKDVDITDNPLLIQYSLETNDLCPFFYIHEKLTPAGELEVVSEAEIWQRFSYIRLRTTLPIMTQQSELADAFQTTRKNIACGGVGFHFPHSNVFLLGNDDESKQISTRELASNSLKNIRGLIDAVDVSMVMKITSEKSAESAVKYAPVIQQIKRPFETLQFHVNVDTLSLVGESVSASQLYSILVESVCRSLRLIERSIVQQLNSDSLKIPQILHFKPKSIAHLITLAYSPDSASEDTQDYKKSLHRALALTLTRPLFRPGNAVRFSSDASPNEPLLQPHKAVTFTAVGEVHVSTVGGLYAYYHYQQDNMNDSGWGCAYRSLQTLFSWFKLQGYTDKPVPSHREIQKCLIDIGDKPAKFLGSNQWIGSTEVGFVLETMLNIEIKILRASSGAKMSDLTWELKEHFDTQGTPVMIGGGVLAHTILGVRYSDDTKDTQWLILDPHYEGAENLNIIVNKGWCGWKGKEFWKKDAFYNMCLPQRPICY